MSISKETRLVRRTFYDKPVYVIQKRVWKDEFFCDTLDQAISEFKDLAYTEEVINIKSIKEEL